MLKKEQNIIASRVRFARNWNEYVFPSRLLKKMAGDDKKAG